jgi:flagellar biosynthesis chaperone FliJ
LDELSLFKEKYGSVTSILRVAELKHDISNLELIIKHLRGGLEILNKGIEKTLAELKEIKKPAKRD